LGVVEEGVAVKFDGLAVCEEYWAAVEGFLIVKSLG
jgi:hypothetical protein